MMLMSACSKSGLSSAALLSTPQLRSMPELRKGNGTCCAFCTHSLCTQLGTRERNPPDLMCESWSALWFPEHIAGHCVIVSKFKIEFVSGKCVHFCRHFLIYASLLFCVLMIVPFESIFFFLCCIVSCFEWDLDQWNNQKEISHHQRKYEPLILLILCCLHPGRHKRRRSSVWSPWNK